jgi:hypothetical protein
MGLSDPETRAEACLNSVDPTKVDAVSLVVSNATSSDTNDCSNGEVPRDLTIYIDDLAVIE